ncbi:MAG TPA: non-homologous end-joining DNA ligase [Terriglobales bacterium]|nr:non-homologous end-joining DNA ligase [Terriglobales bacterium]
MVQRGIRNPKPRPRFIEPMECKRVPSLPEGDGWLYEIKQDGYRAIAVVDGKTAMLYSMSGLDYSRDFSHITFALKNLHAGDLVLDGEIVALDNAGRASFQELQNRKKTKQPIVFYAFDVLHWQGRDTFNSALSERKEMLDELGKHFTGPLRINPYFRTQVGALVAQVKKMGLEGVVAKRADSIYIPGRESDAWQKHRFNQEGEFVVGGYVSAGKNFSSLIVGEYRGRDLYYVKRIAAGFTPGLRARVYKELKALETPDCPFVNLPEPNRSGHGLTAEKMRDCVWLKPERRCELEFVERTKGERLRHAVFRRLIS